LEQGAATLAQIARPGSTGEKKKEEANAGRKKRVWKNKELEERNKMDLNKI
jgi:hypothetical protein